jgi:hypothetical protein
VRGVRYVFTVSFSRRYRGREISRSKVERIMEERKDGGYLLREGKRKRKFCFQNGMKE